jgi:RNA polymerase sigma-32 factor
LRRRYQLPHSATRCLRNRGRYRGEERIALLVDPDTLDKSAPVERLETEALRRVLVEVLATLPDREREIIVATQMVDPPATLEGLGARYGVSKERIRQLRERGFERLKLALAKQGLDRSYFC